MQESRQPLLHLHSAPDSRTTGLMARGDWMLLKNPLIVVRGEPLYGLRNPSLRAPAMSWERELKPDAAGARYGATRATQSVFTPTQDVSGAGFLKQPNATGVGSGTTSATQNAPTPTQGIPAGFASTNARCVQWLPCGYWLSVHYRPFAVSLYTTARRSRRRYPARDSPRQYVRN